jgi:hypothetical protein
MRTSSIPLLCGAVLLVALAGATLAAAQEPPALTGTWRLVEQYYGKGQRNFIGEGEPYRLSLRLEGSRVVGTATRGEQSASWPVFFDSDGPRPLQDLTVTPDADGLGVRATFRVAPGPNDDTWLFVVETLRVEPDGKLAAKMTVAFDRMGERKGSFTWRRVFVREDGP